MCICDCSVVERLEDIVRFAICDFGVELHTKDKVVRSNALYRFDYTMMAKRCDTQTTRHGRKRYRLVVRAHHVERRIADNRA